MDEAAKQALNNAKIIIKSAIEMATPVSEIGTLLNLDGLTATQKVRIGTAINLLNLSREELLRATYPNDSFSNAK